jgi:hypothetical protein
VTLLRSCTERPTYAKGASRAKQASSPYPLADVRRTLRRLRTDQTTVSRQRPLSLRACSTLRPARVLMRSMKPCLRLRGMRFGCHVRFIRYPFYTAFPCDYTLPAARCQTAHEASAESSRFASSLGGLTTLLSSLDDELSQPSGIVVLGSAASGVEVILAYDRPQRTQPQLLERRA